MCAMKPIVPWMGGKRRLAKHIIPLFPKHQCYVEPFCGGAAIFFMKPESKYEVINDINTDIINLYRVTKYHIDELYKQLKWMLTSREIFEWLKVTPPESMTDIQRATRFLYLQKTCFGALSHRNNPSFGTSTTSRARFNIFNFEQVLSDAHLRLSHVTIENMGWQEIIKRYDRPHTLFYCDPPYWEVTGYASAFTWDEYVEINEMMENIQGSMILSINDHTDIRQLFKHEPIQTVKHTYTTSGVQKCKRATELIYGKFNTPLH